MLQVYVLINLCCYCSALTENISLVSVYFYNFGWSDYGVANLTTILDMVKVMAFALQEGKVAVHCHAGLGRTGKFGKDCCGTRFDFSG